MPPKKVNSGTATVITKTPFLIIEIIGFFLSFYLFAISVKLFGDIGIPCTRSKWIGCESILQGFFSHIGPFSIAAMGIIYYICHLMLTTGLKDRFAQIAKVALVIGGIVFIAWLRSLELIYIKKICPWCWGVALLTLIHAGISYRLIVPPLPKLRLLALIGAVLVTFIITIGLTSILELGLGIGTKMMNQERKGTAQYDPESFKSEKDTSDSVKGKSASIAIKTPKPKVATPKPEAPTNKNDRPQNTASTPLPTPDATPAVTPAVAAPSTATSKPVAFDPEPKVNSTEETRILKERGWRHAGSGPSIINAIKASRPKPVLVLAYDPMCNDCHNLITKILSNPSLDSLPVTKVAIQESMLSGQINERVTEMPTMFLFGPDGSQLLKIVGSKFTSEQLADQIKSKL